MRLVIICIVLLASTAFAAPEWYVKQSVERKSSEMLGYGEGSTPDEAFKNAATEVSSQLVVHIQSSGEFSSDSEGNSFQQKYIKSTTSAILRGLEKVKSDMEDGRYYTVVKYVNLPLVSKVAGALGGKACEYTEPNSFLLDTAMGREFQAKLGCVPQLTLYDKSGIWFAEIHGEAFMVKPADFIKLFRSGGSEKLLVRSSKTSLSNGDTYNILININDGTDGYISLFQVNQSGSVSMLMNNHPLNGMTELIYPPVDTYDGMEAYLPDGQNVDRDMTIAAVCEKPLDCGAFTEISTKKNNDGRGLMNLLRQIDRCDYYSIVTEVRR